MSTPYTNDEFIEKAKIIHGDKYDYSLVDYKKSNKKVKIICDKHGEFEQTPNGHLSKKGCQECGRFLTTEEFIEKAKLIHGDKYDYSLVDYKQSRTNVKIICKNHGEFEQTPNCHLDGCGCQKCGKYSTTKEFIKSAKEKHGDKYDYSLVDYKDNATAIKIICKTHGVFEQTPSNHLKYCSCPKCAKEKLKSSTKDFINKAKKVHDNKYDYSLVDYQDSKNKVIIICPIHGEFDQSPDNHKRGKGCPICKESYGEKKIRVFLKNRKIKYIRQQKFNDCKYDKLLRFDFYLPDLNICIEYDGEQHFISANHWGGESELEKQQIKDNIKTKYCESNNISLLRIKYNENVEEILLNYLTTYMIKKDIINKKIIHD